MRLGKRSLWPVLANCAILLEGDSQERANRVMQAVWQMKKLDIETLKRAAETPVA